MLIICFKCMWPLFASCMQVRSHMYVVHVYIDSLLSHKHKQDNNLFLPPLKSFSLSMIHTHMNNKTYTLTFCQHQKLKVYTCTALSWCMKLTTIPRRVLFGVGIGSIRCSFLWCLVRRGSVSAKQGAHFMGQTIFLSSNLLSLFLFHIGHHFVLSTLY